jgi:TRAP-type C4-dicarboxylate transport system permease small subunit
MISAITRVSKLLSLATQTVAGLGLVAMTAIIGWQVFARYVLNAAPAWSEQAALVILVSFVLLAAAVGVREGFHIRLTALVEAMPRPWSDIAIVVAHIVVAAFGVALAVFGAELVQGTWTHTIPTLPIPRGAAYLPIPAAGALIVFFSLEHVLALVRGTKVEPLWN